MEKIQVKGMTEAEMAEVLVPLGVEKYRCRQILEWVYGRGAYTFNEMTNLPLALRDKLAEIAVITNLRLVTRQLSADGATTKYLFRLTDGHTVESVLLKYVFGNTVCVSTQVGCAMGCRFCASTLGGLVRDLAAGEILDQVLAIQRDLARRGERVGGIVIMGTGEPLANYDNTIKFIRLAHLPYGLNIGYRHITLSTSGLVPEMERLAMEGLPVTLSVSLHAPNDDLRSQLMPINRRYPIPELMAACDAYIVATNRRITFEYTLIKDVNDREKHARELGALLRGRLCNVNLIPLNPVQEREFVPPPPERVKTFRKILEQYGITVTVRRELGADVQAACGQLRRRYLAEENVPGCE